ncbi:immunoglobulin superfamily member 1-like [Mauremys reevesii]|uniref:immunoglobulin superfamily member 1-like n=1 Tax=Mauremys reevesii TaxID=260615 RepID=UPI00193FBFCA|nr:immunoglobulin superfamily member 1-like [Mauremys reevesii]
MASALTVLFLGREYPKPTIWVSPSRVVALGGSVTICCEGRYLGMEFVLRKAGHPNLQVRMVPDGPVAEFPIPSVSREDGGSYTCDYRSIMEPSRWSYPSDPVEIIVAEGRHFTSMDSDGLEVVFPISDVHQEDGGSYSCSYHSKSEPFNVSYPSDPVELVVREAPPEHPDFTHANITRLGLGAAVLLVLGLILAEAYYSRPRGAS